MISTSLSVMKCMVVMVIASVLIIIVAIIIIIYMYIKFIKLIVDNLSHCQFESLSPLIIFVKGNGNDVLVIICRSLSLGCW